MNTTAVLLVEVKEEPTLKYFKWADSQAEINNFVKMISPDLPSVEIFADEGSEVKFIK